MFSNKKVTPVVTDDLLEIENKFFPAFITQSFFSVNSTRYFIMEIPDKQQLRKTEINYLSNIELNFTKKNAQQNHILIW